VCLVIIAQVENVRVYKYDVLLVFLHCNSGKVADSWLKIVGAKPNRNPNRNPTILSHETAT